MSQLWAGAALCHLLLQCGQELCMFLVLLGWCAAQTLQASRLLSLQSTSLVHSEIFSKTYSTDFTDLFSCSLKFPLIYLNIWTSTWWFGPNLFSVWHKILFCNLNHCDFRDFLWLRFSGSKTFFWRSSFHKLQISFKEDCEMGKLLFKLINNLKRIQVEV